jgi:hypothetical protein
MNDQDAFVNKSENGNVMAAEFKGVFSLSSLLLPAIPGIQIAELGATYVALMFCCFPYSSLLLLNYEKWWSPLPSSSPLTFML